MPIPMLCWDTPHRAGNPMSGPRAIDKSPCFMASAPRAAFQRKGSITTSK